MTEKDGDKIYNQTKKKDHISHEGKKKKEHYDKRLVMFCKQMPR